MRPREGLPQFLHIWWTGTNPQTGEPVVLEAVLCLRHRQDIASRFSGVRGTGQHGESCDVCEGRRPRTSLYLSPLGEQRDGPPLRVCRRAATSGPGPARPTPPGCSRTGAER